MLYDLSEFANNTFKKHGVVDRIVWIKWGRHFVMFRNNLCSTFWCVIKHSELCENNSSVGQHMNVNEDSVEVTVFGVSASVSFIVPFVGLRTSNLRRCAF
jgi:hypothetical protein